MSDLDIVMQEIEAYQSFISSAIYTHKKEGHIKALEVIAEALGVAVDTINARYNYLILLMESLPIPE